MIWLLGTGAMSVEYSKVLKHQRLNFHAIGRSKASTEAFRVATGADATPGGLAAFLEQQPQVAQAAIVAVNVEQLFPTTLQLIQAGVPSILVEKPAALALAELEQLQAAAKNAGCNVYIAYNRRFFASVLKAQDIIQADGGVTSFQFEVTEWSHIIQNLDNPDEVMQAWFIANTSHVVDLAWHLGGAPEELACFTHGTLDWHRAASQFSGAGKSQSGATFAYQGNWCAPGRWALEFCTAAHRLIFKPMEQLQIQEIGSVAVNPLSIDDALDQEFKPGLHAQVASFLGADKSRLCSLEEQVQHFHLYQRMAGYSPSPAKR